MPRYHRIRLLRLPLQPISPRLPPPTVRPRSPDELTPWKFLYRTVKALVFSKQIKLGHIIEFDDSDFAKRFDRVARKMMFANAMTSPLAALLLWAVLGISLLICASTYKLSEVIENIAETMHSPPNNGNGVQGHARANP